VIVWYPCVSIHSICPEKSLGETVKALAIAGSPGAL
jgi:hypothetical protein